MAGLATALTSTGRDVTYVAEQEMSRVRAALGWKAPELGNVRPRFVTNARSVRAAIQDAPMNSIHIRQGLRGNGLIAMAGKALAEHKLRQWIIMETVDDTGWRGAFKRLEYRRLIRCQDGSIEGVLAIGEATANWLAELGMPAQKACPFAYFLPETTRAEAFQPDAHFRFLFVGRLVELKRIDMLIDALGSLGREVFDLTVVGNGPLETRLRAQADRKLPGRVHWLGRRSADEIPALMAKADCLVLPSRYDGWGAVVSEALIAGTPVICSDRCGAAGALRASGCGDVFPANDMKALTDCLGRAISRGRQTPPSRQRLANWAGRSLGAKAGADYLDAILLHAEGSGRRPIPPWEHEHSA